MSNEYKQCPNGHYYQGLRCPYCKTGKGEGDASSTKTQIFGGADVQMPTETATQTVQRGTAIPDRGNYSGPQMNYDSNMMSGGRAQAAPMSGSRTVFGDEEEIGMSSFSHGSVGNAGGYRLTRKLVGWLVSYSLDALGVDFKLYEGRNIIGRDADCNISVNDNMVSGKHAVLLFRAGKYSITDSQSSHGTFVNGRDIELEPCYIQDGDEIRMGKTIFKFRTSL